MDVFGKVRFLAIVIRMGSCGRKTSRFAPTVLFVVILKNIAIFLDNKYFNVSGCASDL